MSEYMTADEVCQKLHISINQLNRIRQRREITFFKFGGAPRFRVEDVEDYAERQCIKAEKLSRCARMEKAAEQPVYQIGQVYVPGMKVV